MLHIYLVMRKPPFNKSMLNAIRGCFSMVATERNFQIEFAAFLINLFLILYLHLSYTDAAIILLLCFAVLFAEAINTAIETLCDMVQPEYDVRIKFIKDISAGAVLLLAIASVLCGGLIYSKYIF